MLTIMCEISSSLLCCESCFTEGLTAGGGIAKDKLREVYEECHVFFDNRLLVGGGWIIPIYIGEQDTPEEHYKDVQSPLLSLWGISEELKVDKWITSFDESGFKESKSRFSDYDKDRT